MNLQDAVVAGRYARALFEAAQAAKAVDAVRKDLAGLAEAFRKDGGLAARLQHPRLSTAEKQAQAVKAMGRAPQPLAGRFIALLLAKKRVALLPFIAGCFDGHADRAQGIVKAHVAAAAALSDGQSRTLAAGLEKVLKAKVTMDVSLDDTLLGGVVVRVGDRLWDLSLKGRVRRLKEALLEASTN